MSNEAREVKRYLLEYGADNYWFSEELGEEQGEDQVVVLSSAYDKLKAEREACARHYEHERETNSVLNGENQTISYKLDALAASHAELVEALESMTPPMPPANAACHRNVVQQKKCANCQRIARAHTALTRAKELV